MAKPSPKHIVLTCRKAAARHDRRRMQTKTALRRTEWKPRGTWKHARANGVRVKASASAAQPSKRVFAEINTKEQFLKAVAMIEASKMLPETAAPAIMELYKSYSDAVISSGVEDAETVATKMIATVVDRVLLQFEEPYSFPSFHQRMLEPFDYYDFGQQYTGNLINFEQSYVGHLERWADVAKYVEAGDNVVLVANHQTEADPAVFALLLEEIYPKLATDVIYVAGDRVVGDPMCKPFSMGRNLLCVHSKKRLEDIPELKDAKIRQNRRTVLEMAKMLARGGNLIWVAPAGGRDRPNADDVFFPAPWDPSAVELMRKLGTSAKPKLHMFPLAMLSHDIMPPPKSIEKQIGEQRVCKFHGVAISLAEELDLQTIASHASEDKEQAQEQLKDIAYEAMEKEYWVLDAAVHKGEVSSYLQQPFPSKLPVNTGA